MLSKEGRKCWEWFGFVAISAGSHLQVSKQFISVSHLGQMSVMRADRLPSEVLQSGFSWWSRSTSALNTGRPGSQETWGSLPSTSPSGSSSANGADPFALSPSQGACNLSTLNGACDLSALDRVVLNAGKDSPFLQCMGEWKLALSVLASSRVKLSHQPGMLILEGETRDYRVQSPSCTNRETKTKTSPGAHATDGW
jgi:hypothetical protein